jgi:hypothetical protein
MKCYNAQCLNNLETPWHSDTTFSLMNTPQLQLTPCRISIKDVTIVQVSLDMHTSENQLPDSVNTMTLLGSCGSHWTLWTPQLFWGVVVRSLPSTVRSRNHKHQPLGKWLPKNITGVEFLTCVCTRTHACVLASLMPFNTQFTHRVSHLCVSSSEHLFDTGFPQTSHTRCFFTSSINEFPCANILPHVYYIGLYSQVWNLWQEIYYARKMYIYVYIEYQWQWLTNEPNIPR